MFIVEIINKESTINKVSWRKPQFWNELLLEARGMIERITAVLKQTIHHTSLQENFDVVTQHQVPTHTPAETILRRTGLFLPAHLFILANSTMIRVLTVKNPTARVEAGLHVGLS